MPNIHACAFYGLGINYTHVFDCWMEKEKF